MSKQPTISALIIARNEERMIAQCIACLQWCDEVILIDDGSTDATRQIAEQAGATVISFKNASFAKLRQEALRRAQSEWVIYIDADERVTPLLAKEIRVNVETAVAPVLKLKRENYFYGEHVSFGGTQNDWTERVFHKQHIQGWKGTIHESPIHTGAVQKIDTPLMHFTHRTTQESLHKSAEWTILEAEALYAAKLPPVTFLTIIRKGCMEFLRRAIFQKGYKDGLTGLIEALVQGINKIFIYIQVWELQKKPTIADRYAKQEERVRSLWKREI